MTDAGKETKKQRVQAKLLTELAYNPIASRSAIAENFSFYSNIFQ